MFPARLFILSALFASAFVPAAAAEIAWQPWSAAAFAQARREHKPVVMDLEAVWCHWCHVMDNTTYRDPAVVALLRDRFVAVRVDQDARPDLSRRYEDYGWPATVIFAPDGRELAKRQGWLPPEEMRALLAAALREPAPPADETAPRIPAGGAFTLARRDALHRRWLDGYDFQRGGWSEAHKFLDWDNTEYALHLARAGDARAAAMARQMLRQERKLIDPAWGGAYQYSIDDWVHPHFEKIVSVQAGVLRIYAESYALWGDPADLRSARQIHDYLRKFLTSPDGVVYASQDADLVPGEESADYFALDDAQRRARGIPRVDRHIYARENGWVIEAFAEQAEAMGNSGCRDEALRAADWIIAHRALRGGGFSHGAHDAAGPYLGDTLAMGRAFFALYQLTGDRLWLTRAAQAAGFIRAHFPMPDGAGFASAETTQAAFPPPTPEFDENTALARFANGLFYATDNAADRSMTQAALRWLLAPGVAEAAGPYVGGLLLAGEEAQTAPLHIVIVGGKDDPSARALHAAALRAPDVYKLVEWWDRREGPPPGGGDIYPPMGRAAAFVCSGRACSEPAFTAAELEARLAQIARRRG